MAKAKRGRSREKFPKHSTTTPKKEKKDSSIRAKKGLDRQNRRRDPKVAQGH